MASPAAATDSVPGTTFIRQHFKRKGDRLELKVPINPASPALGTILFMCFGASFMIFFTGKPLLELQIIGLTICILLIPGLICLRNSFEYTWLVVGPHKWRAVSGWMWSTTPDPDRFVKGAFITHQKEGRIKDFISVTVVNQGSFEILMFESTTTRFQLEPCKLQMHSHADKEWLADQINNFMNEMKGRSHAIDGTNELQSTQAWPLQADSNYSTLQESLRPVDAVGAFIPNIIRTGNRLDVVTTRPAATYSTRICLAIIAAISALVIGGTAASRRRDADIWVYIVFGIILLIVFPNLTGKGSKGSWLIVEQSTWQLTTFSWKEISKIDTNTMDPSKIGNMVKGCIQELCGAFVDETYNYDDSGNSSTTYYMSLRVQKHPAENPTVIHVHETNQYEAQWLADEVNKHIKIVKEEPVTINNENSRTSTVATKEQSSAAAAVVVEPSAAAVAVIAREPSAAMATMSAAKGREFSTLVDEWLGTR
ncbi:hypothetical protein Vafri_14234 [Volvox africanus]|uniref:Uncharacterized protein n=1 Tax=Volvox africanus TaxID=51714 RepID=A0A8J4BDX3_9CHLO|nr:hypothetical protein Vafri_14234 [Volvox africanus]